MRDQITTNYGNLWLINFTAIHFVRWRVLRIFDAPLEWLRQYYVIILSKNSDKPLYSKNDLSQVWWQFGGFQAQNSMQNILMQKQFHFNILRGQKFVVFFIFRSYKFKRSNRLRPLARTSPWITVTSEDAAPGTTTAVQNIFTNVVRIGSAAVARPAFSRR